VPKAARRPIYNGHKTPPVSSSPSVPAKVVRPFRDVVADHNKAVQAIYDKAVADAGPVVRQVSVATGGIPELGPGAADPIPFPIGPDPFPIGPGSPFGKPQLPSYPWPGQQPLTPQAPRSPGWPDPLLRKPVQDPFQAPPEAPPQGPVGPPGGRIIPGWAPTLIDLILGAALLNSLAQPGNHGEDSDSERNCLNSNYGRNLVEYAPLDYSHGKPRATGAHACLVTHAPWDNRNRVDPEGRAKGMDRSHLVAREFGGSNKNPGNIVPLYPSANRLSRNSTNNMRHFELEVGAHLNGRERVYYDVRPHYGTNPYIPDYVDMYARSTSGWSLRDRIKNP
jgi:hypothetical protein